MHQIYLTVSQHKKYIEVLQFKFKVHPIRSSNVKRDATPDSRLLCCTLTCTCVSVNPCAVHTGGLSGRQSAVFTHACACARRVEMLRPSPCTSRLDARLSGSGRRWEQTVLFFQPCVAAEGYAHWTDPTALLCSQTKSGVRTCVPLYCMGERGTFSFFSSFYRYVWKHVYASIALWKRACVFVRPRENAALEGKRGSCALSNGPWFPEGPNYGMQPCHSGTAEVVWGHTECAEEAGILHVRGERLS